MKTSILVIAFIILPFDSELYPNFLQKFLIFSLVNPTPEYQM